MVATIKEKKRFTVEEYFAFEERKAEKYEFHNGKLIKMSGATTNHNIIAMNVALAIKMALKKIEKKHYILGSDTKIHIPELKRFVYPDAVVIAEEIIHYENRKDTIVNPLLIIEVLSSSTRNYDIGGKFHKYQTIDSFKEYVLIEQDFPEVIAHFREEEDLWRVQRNRDLMTGEIQLKSIGCRISLSDIYEMIDWESEEF